MFCRNCGKQNADDDKFCAHCGAQLDAPVASGSQAGQQASVPGQPTPLQQASPQSVPQLASQPVPQPQPAGKGKLIALVVAAVIAAALAVAAVVTGGFGMTGNQSGSGAGSVASESASSEPESESAGSSEADSTSSQSSQPSEFDSEPSLEKLPNDYAARAQEIAMATFTNSKQTGGRMHWVGSDVSKYISPNKVGIDENLLEQLESRDYMVVAKSCELLENDGEARKYRVQVVYEQSLNADGTNVQANIAVVWLWLDTDGQALSLSVR